MIIKNADKNALDVEIRDELGSIILNVLEFDTITKKAKLYARLLYKNDVKKPVAIIGDNIFDGQRDVVTFECHLLGHKAYNKITGEEIV